MTKRGDFSYKLSEKTIVDVLCHVRAEIIRDKRWNLQHHVEALLRARGFNPEEGRVPRRQERKFKAGALRLLLIDALRDGPKNLDDLVGSVLISRPDLSYSDARKRVLIGLSNMRQKGTVIREGGGYGLEAPSATRTSPPNDKNRSSRIKKLSHLLCYKTRD